MRRDFASQNNTIFVFCKYEAEFYNPFNFTDRRDLNLTTCL